MKQVKQRKKLQLKHAKDILNIPTLFVPSDEEYAKKYFKECDEYGLYRTQPLEAGKSMDDRENLRFSIQAPDGTYINPKRQWIWSKEHVEEGIRNHTIGFKQDKNNQWTVFIKQYLHDENGEQRKTKQFSIIDGIYTQHGTKEIENIFGDLNVFKFPKPSDLIKKLLQIADYIDNPLILDYFAGSGTTGQAVLELNEEDGKNRNFILCTNNENNICEEVTYQRLKTVITGQRKDGSFYSEGLPTNLKYYKVDFIPKDSEELFDELLRHSKEMIQLKNREDIENKKILVINNDDEMDKVENILSSEKNLYSIYIADDVLLSTKQEKLINSLDVHIVPDCFFENELREAGEIW